MNDKRKAQKSVDTVRNYESKIKTDITRKKRERNV